MSFTRNLPVDKNGNVYYGPKTSAEAMAAIDNGASPAQVIEMLKDAGYVGVASRIAIAYAGQLS
jgi:hypothetical protein